jgi:hypothetical protein
MPVATGASAGVGARAKPSGREYYQITSRGIEALYKPVRWTKLGICRVLGKVLFKAVAWLPEDPHATFVARQVMEIIKSRRRDPPSKDDVLRNLRVSNSSFEETMRFLTAHELVTKTYRGGGREGGAARMTGTS